MRHHAGFTRAISRSLRNVIKYSHEEKYMFQVHLYSSKVIIYRSTVSDSAHLTTHESYRRSSLVSSPARCVAVLGIETVISARLERLKSFSVRIARILLRDTSNLSQIIGTHHRFQPFDTTASLRTWSVRCRINKPTASREHRY